MISLMTLFWILVIVFALLGTGRGWAREIIATAGLCLSLFTIQLLSGRVLGLLNLLDDPSRPLQVGTNVLYQRQFWVLTAFHIVVTIFSYQGPSIGPLGSRLSAQKRIQERLLGGILGAANGYLIFGTILGFLEFHYTTQGLQRLPPGGFYPFDASILTRPLDALNIFILSNLPLQVLGSVLVFVLILVFFFVLIVLI